MEHETTDNQEQAADLAELERMAAGLAPPAAVAEAEPAGLITPSASVAAEAETMVNLLADAVETFFPCLTYSPETRQTGAAKLAPLLEKYNLGGGLLAKWGAEIEAGMFFGGVIFASINAVKEDKAARQAEKQGGGHAPGANDAAPGAAGVSFGEVQPAGA